MLRNPWRVAAVSATVVGPTAYLYHIYVRRPRQETFEITVAATASDGKRSYARRTITRLPPEETEKRISALAMSRAVPRPDGIVWKYATAQLPSNNPIEDAYASAIFERDPGRAVSGPDGDYLFFAVLDGHGGPNTSRLLSKTLIPAVALQLNNLARPPSTYLPRPQHKSSWLDSIRFLHLFSSGMPSTPVRFDADPKYVSAAIRTAFAMVDSDLVNAPLRLIAEHHAQSKSGGGPPDLSHHPMALATMLPAISGSCALLAMLDTTHRDLYVACTGDCRAVAGVWEEGSNGTGTWRADVLSEDQTGRSPSELERIQSEHPADEKGTVIQRGRVLGSLEPSRAFGDARYKWPLHIQGLLARVFLDGNNVPLRRPPGEFKTPPYVTADPVVTHRKLDFLPLPDTPLSTPFPTLLRNNSSAAASSSTSADQASAPTAPPRSSKLRFLILATDGLWDKLSSRDAVALVAGHLSGLRTASISRSALDEMVPTRVGSAGVDGKACTEEQQKQQQHPWAFIDENPGTHLVRNAFGGADTQGLRKWLSIPAPWSRRYRDDVTVTVVWWEDGRASEAWVERIEVLSKSKSKSLLAFDSSPLKVQEDSVKSKL